MDFGDLRVATGKDLETAGNCNVTSDKCFRISWAIRKSFYYMDEEIFRVFIIHDLVRPQLEYGI